MSLSSPEGLIRDTVWSGIGRVATIGISLFLTPYILGRVGQLVPSLAISLRDFRWRVWKELFSFGWKIQLARVCEILTFPFDRFFLGVIAGGGALGRFQPAVQVAAQARMTPHYVVLAAGGELPPQARPVS